MTGTDLQPVTDAELVRRAISANGDPGQLAPVFEAIAERYCDTVLRWCAGKGLDHQAAQDVGQTVFEDAFTSLAGGRGPNQADMLGRWLAGFGTSMHRVRLPAPLYVCTDSCTRPRRISTQASSDSVNALAPVTANLYRENQALRAALDHHTPARNQNEQPHTDNH